MKIQKRKLEIAILCLLLGSAIIVCLWPEKEQSYSLDVDQDGDAVLFGKLEYTISLPDDLSAFAELPATQLFDAYDADRDARFVRFHGRFEHQNETLEVPGFVMKESADGPWLWRVRWSPTHVGEWRASLVFEGATPTTGLIHFTHQLPQAIVVEANAHALGHLQPPGPDDNPAYLVERSPDGPRSTWLFGACRSWVIRDEREEAVWKGAEWIDRKTELYPILRESGYNLLNQWMAPWEFLLVHKEPKEHWRKDDGYWRSTQIPEAEHWQSHRYYDQGRALAFDELVEQCEGGEDKELIRLLLVPLPHPVFRHTLHPWHNGYSGWSTWENPDLPKNTMNGFCLRETMSAWEFFDADPRPATDQPEAKLFDHQTNFYRYLIARWSYSRAIGIWVLLDEIEGIGDEEGYMPYKTGYWNHPQCERWLGDITRMFKGELVRPGDGLRYLGDPYRHPVSASTTSSLGQGQRGANVDWLGGRIGDRPDIHGWHWYPALFPPVLDWDNAWTSTIDGVRSYTKAPLGDKPRLISEFGAPDRIAPIFEPSSLYPGIYHFGIWTAILDGHAGTPMEWNDGKEFGELRWRTRPGPFSRKNYPIDLPRELTALRRFLAGHEPGDFVSGQGLDPRIHCMAGESVRLHTLHHRTQDIVLGWLYGDQGDAEFTVSGLEGGRYRLTWFDPWTGRPLPNSQEFDVQPQDTIAVSAGHILQQMQAGHPSFPWSTRYPKGNDVAFKLQQFD